MSTFEQNNKPNQLRGRSPIMNAKTLKVSLLIAAMASPAAALAQTPPVDAGQTTQDLRTPVDPPRPSPSLRIEGPALSEAEPGGPTVTVGRVAWRGNTVISSDTLDEVASEYIGQDLDLAALRTLANTISRYYRDQGYLFARAFVPPQTVDDGTVEIEVVEGRYGRIIVDGHPDLVRGARGYLSRLQPGDVIHGDRLERHTLLLSDQPGVRSSPVMQPGQEAGEGDLRVRIDRGRRYDGDITLDSYGNRYTGRHRARINAALNSPFTFGDRLSASLMYTEEEMVYGSVRYALPVGRDGVRVSVGHTRTDYELGREFAPIGATGIAEITELGISYPLIRSQRTNLTPEATLSYKNLRDEVELAGIRETKTSWVLPLMMSFDHRDDWLGSAGLTYGRVGVTLGKLSLGDVLKAQDEAAGTDGSFEKANLEVIRIQSLPENFSLYLRASGQYAGDNLDSSESFSLGGAHGVRGYPSGEGSGDRGWLSQVELRHELNQWAPFQMTPYVFYDTGRVTINAEDYNADSNSRTISGAGAGSRFRYQQFDANLTLAWRTNGGEPQSDQVDNRPILWSELRFRF